MAEENIVTKTKIKAMAYILVLGALFRYVTTPIVLLIYIIPKPETASSALT